MGAVVGSCTVYDTDLRPADGASSGNSDGSGDAGRGGSSLGGASGGGTPASAGKSGSGSGGQAASAGNQAAGAEGGSGEAGAGSETAGTGGTSGAGGVAGTGGTAGAGSGTGGTGGSAGSGGSGGTGTPPVLCSEHPLTPKAMWTATASRFSPGNGMESDPLYNPASHMLDGSNNERWSTGFQQLGGEWIQIDFKAIVNLKRIDLRLMSDEGGNGADYPRAYAVRMTNFAGDATGPVLQSGAGTPNANLVVTFPAPVTGQFLLIHQTGVAENGLSWWTVAELSVSCTD